MRIGTWNVEYAAGTAKNAARLRRLRDARADLWVLTETHDDLDLSATHAAVRSEQRPTGRAGARWVTIWSAFPVVRVVATSDQVRTTAAIVDAPRGPLLVYGTVMPWHSDRGVSGTARGWVEHHRVVPEQAREWVALLSRFELGRPESKRAFVDLFDRERHHRVPHLRSLVPDRATAKLDESIRERMERRLLPWQRPMHSVRASDRQASGGSSDLTQAENLSVRNLQEIDDVHVHSSARDRRDNHLSIFVRRHFEHREAVRVGFAECEVSSGGGAIGIVGGRPALPVRPFRAAQVEGHARFARTLQSAELSECVVDRLDEKRFALFGAVRNE
jgi:hypothetical protein